jgi:hypothetical protein
LAGIQSRSGTLSEGLFGQFGKCEAVRAHSNFAKNFITDAQDEQLRDHIEITVGIGGLILHAVYFGSELPVFVREHPVSPMLLDLQVLPCESGWASCIDKVMRGRESNAVILPRYWVEHDYGTQSSAAGVYEDQKSLRFLIFPPLHGFDFQGTAEEYKAFYRPVLQLARKWPKVTLLANTVLEQSEERKENAWTGFIAALETEYE